MPELTLDDVTLHYDQSGEGSDIVWLAAGDHPGRNWRRWQVPAFEPGWRNTTYDARGVGATESRTASPWTIEVHAGDLARLIEETCEPPVALVGLSMGSLIAVQLAHDRPDLVRCAAAMGTCVRKTGFILEWEEAEIRLRREGGSLPADFATAHYALCYYPAEVLGDDALWAELRSFIAADFEARDGRMLAAQWQACLDFDSSELLPRDDGPDPRDRVLGGRPDAPAARAPGRRAGGRRPLPPAPGPRARLGVRPPSRRGQRARARDHLELRARADLDRLAQDSFKGGRVREQPLRVLVGGRLEHLTDRPVLDDAPAVQHRDPVRDRADQREVVRDEEEPEAELALQLGDQVDDRGLHRDVERRRDLVAHEQRRRDRERAGDRDALALAAGELVRVAVDHRRAQRDPLERSMTRFSARSPRSELEDPQRLADRSGRSSCAG